MELGFCRAGQGGARCPTHGTGRHARQRQAHPFARRRSWCVCGALRLTCSCCHSAACSERAAATASAGCSWSHFWCSAMLAAWAAACCCSATSAVATAWAAASCRLSSASCCSPACRAASSLYSSACRRHHHSSDRSAVVVAVRQPGGYVCSSLACSGAHTAGMWNMEHVLRAKQPCCAGPAAAVSNTTCPIEEQPLPSTACPLATHMPSNLQLLHAAGSRRLELPSSRCCRDRCG